MNSSTFLIVLIISCLAISSLWAKPAGDNESSGDAFDAILRGDEEPTEKSKSSEEVPEADDSSSSDHDDDDDDDDDKDFEAMWQQLVNGSSDVPPESLNVSEEFSNSTSVTEVVNGTRVTVNETVEKLTDENGDTIIQVQTISISSEEESHSD